MYHLLYVIKDENQDQEDEDELYFLPYCRI